MRALQISVIYSAFFITTFQITYEKLHGVDQLNEFNSVIILSPFKISIASIYVFMRNTSADLMFTVLYYRNTGPATNLFFLSHSPRI